MNWMGLARWYEWVFGMILMVTIGVIVILPLVGCFSWWALIIGLFLYFIASLARSWDDARRMRKGT